MNQSQTRPEGLPAETKTITVRVPVPAKEETISVAASKQGATIQVGVAAYKLRRSEALALADALVDCTEFFA